MNTSNPGAPVQSGTFQKNTFGGDAVGIDFNPSGDERVLRIKQLYANIIDELAGPDGAKLGGNGDTSLAGRILGRAVNDAIVAQMLAVKAITLPTT